MQGLICATGQAAACLGLSDRGVLRSGVRADLVTVAGNPFQYHDVLRAPTHVLIAGHIAHHVEQQPLTYSLRGRFAAGVVVLLLTFVLRPRPTPPPDVVGRSDL